MPYIIFSIAAIGTVVAVLLIRNKRIHYMKKKESEIRQLINDYYRDYDSLTKGHFVDEACRNSFAEKWYDKYSSLKKNTVKTNGELTNIILQFFSDYESLGDKIAYSNNIFLIRQKETDIRTKIAKFYYERNRLTENYISHSDELLFSLTAKNDFDFISAFDIPKDDPLYSEVEEYKESVTKIHLFVDESNESFCREEILRCDSILSDIDGKSLDQQQRKVVVSDEDHTLVLAGAGSGKTLTISGKVKYLCSVKGINPEDILLIAFTRKSAEQMSERIVNRLGINVHATTFHKLGLDILKLNKNHTLDIIDDLNGFVADYFEKKIITNPSEIKNLIEYFAYYLNIPAELDKVESLGDMFEHERSMDFETIRSKYEKAEYIDNVASENRKSKETLMGEQVKSMDEVTIANYLFLNGINYEYEKAYPYADSSDTTHRAYHPDFYLPDYDLYIEHFGIDKNGKLPWLSPIEEQKYKEGMQWKREVHSAHHTCLLETYSYYSSEGILLDKLHDLLYEHDVKFKEPDYKDIFEKVYGSETERYFSELIKLICTFITLFKSNGYRSEAFTNLKYNSPLDNSKYHVLRKNLFIQIIRPIFDAYEEFLDSRNAVDFSDMINQATSAVESGTLPGTYKYIIIDEFQDISVARYKLIKAILTKTDAKLLCVGDDWQSIYRFAGSDISIFTNFASYFGYSKILKIEKTYRNSQQLIDAVGKFVVQNPMQLKKDLRSEKSLDYPLAFIPFAENPFHALEQSMDKIISGFGKEASILLLGRTSYDFEFVKESGLFSISVQNGETDISYRKSPDTPVSFLTVHKAKGLEADNVILLNFKNATLGFPNKISDDPLIGLVLSSPDTFSYAEERRLLYVALTRTKNRLFVLYDSKKPSEFLKDFAGISSVYIGTIGQKEISKRIMCPRCKTGILTVRQNEGSNKYFVGCSNYPHCDYTVKDTSILSDTKRCPACGGFMIKRKGKHGLFYGCSNYPLCNNTMEINYSPNRKTGFN